MSQSSLVTKQWWANETNYTKGRSDTIHGIVIHHAASTSLDSVGTVFSQAGRGGSAHYGVKGNQIHQYVREEDTAWHCGDWLGNCCTIGIETVNSTGAPDWLVDDDTFNTLVKLVAEIAKRNNLGKLKFEPDGVYPTLSAHRDWSATYCPGDYLYSRMNELADKANKINYPEKQPEPTPKPEPKPDEPKPKPSGEGQPDNPRGLSDEEYKKILKQMKDIEDNAKEQNVMIPMSNKVYDILKIIAIVILPLVQALYVGLSKIWGFGFGTEIDQTIQLVVAAINTVLGLALVKSSSDYHKGANND